MAKVYLAVDESLDRKVALKVMISSLAADDSFRERFLAEARDTAKFSHPGIVSIHSTGVHENQYFLVLEYLESGTLKDHLQARRKHSDQQGDPVTVDLGYSPREALILTRQLADALAYAHSKDVIHRDLKPANILFNQEGAAVLSDFGIAKSVSDNRELTMTGYSVGTPAYMSPEQKLGASIDGRSDLYSLGVVLFEILTGHKPYASRPGNFGDLKRELDAEVPLLEDSCSELQPILNRLLAKNPDDRFASAQELIRTIEGLPLFHGGNGDETVIQPSPGSAGDTGTARQSTSQTRMEVPASRPVWLLGGIAGAVLLLIVVAWFVVGQESIPEPDPVDAQTAERISQLVERAALYADNDWLIDPPGSNAVEALQRALELQPGNRTVITELETLEKQVVTMVTNTIGAGNPEQSRATAELALFYFPENSELAELKEEIQ